MLYDNSSRYLVLSCSLGLALITAGCTGAVPGLGGTADGTGVGGTGRGGRGNDPGSGGEDGAVEGPFTPDEGPPVVESAGPMALRRLSRTEYNNTLRDLLKLATLPDAGLPADGFSEDGYVVSTPIGELEVRRYLEAADGIVSKLDVAQTTGCRAGANEDTCLQDFVRRFGRKAFRRPLESSEVQSWIAFHKALRTDAQATFDEATKDVIGGMLQSPHFLYHNQVSNEAPQVENGLIRLNPHEVAARLSYFLWGTLPDDELFAVVDGGKLSTAADVEKQARRMLAHDRAKATVAQFHQLWLGIAGLEDLQKDQGKFPEYNAALARAMVEETSRFVQDVYADDGKFETLLTSPRTFLNGPLARLYGVQGISGESFAPSTLPPSRAGLLTHASFLTRKALPGESHPVMRGHFLLVHALCTNIPSPPNDIPPPKEPSPTLSTRERFAEHGSADCARACHELIDPLGFAFEHFDAIGKYRSMDGGKPVDASGQLEIEGKPLRFANAKELVQQLGKNDEARACFAKHWFGFALGRRLLDEDTGSMNRAFSSFAQGDYDMRELLAALASTRTFLHRKPTTGEVTQ